MTETSQLQRCDKCGAILSGYAQDRLCAACLLESAILEPEAPAAARVASTPLLAFKDYELLEEIARGGMGVVYQARQISLNRTVAVKMILGGHLANAAEIKRFRAEAETAAQLRHPNIVAIHEVGEHTGHPFFSMELVQGQNLSQLVRDEPLPSRKAAAYLKTIAEAIQYAHSRGVLHRDLKPSNILIDENDQPRITDFGLAKRLTDSQLSTNDPQLTQTGQVLGSPSFIPPEQAAGRKDHIGPASDVYSLGAILYHLLTGRPPFVAGTLTQTLRMAAEQGPIPPRLLNAGIPRDLETICLKCLEKDPWRRYGSAGELAKELERFLRHEVIHARPVSPKERLWRWCCRQPKLATAMGIAAGLLIAVTIVSTLASLRIQKARMGEERNRIRAEQAAVSTRQNLYVADMSLAQIYLASGNIGRVRSLVEAHWPERGEPDVRGFEWRRLWAACRSESIATWPGHKAVVADLSISPDGTTLLSGGSDGIARFWNLATGVPLADLPKFPNVLLSVAFSPDGSMFAVGSQVDGATLWDTSRRERIARLGGTNSTVTFSPDGQRLAIANRTDFYPRHGTDTMLWNLKEGRLERTFDSAGVCATFSRDGSLLALGSASGLVRVWHLVEKRFVASITRPNPTLALAFSPDGSQLVISSWEPHGEVQVWNLSQQKIERSLTEHSGMVWDVRFSPDGRTLATASSDQTIRLWDASQWRTKKVLHGHGDEVWRAEFTADGNRLITGGKDENIMVWSIAETTPVDDIAAARSHVVVSPDASKIAAQDSDGMVALWDASTGLRLRAFPTEEWPLGFLENGNILVTLRRPSFISFWKIPAGTIQSQTKLGGEQSPDWARLSTDGKALVTGQADSTLRFWELATGELRGVLSEQIGTESTCAFSPSGQFFASASRNVVSIYDRTSLHPVVELTGHAMDVDLVAVSWDGKLLASGSADGTVVVWDLATKRQLQRLAHKNGGGVGALAFSPDNKTLVACNTLEEIWWNLTTSREILTRDIKCTLDRPQFSADGRLFTISDPQRGCLLTRAPSFAECSGGLASGR